MTERASPAEAKIEAQRYDGSLETAPYHCVFWLFVSDLALSGRFASSSPKGGAKCAFHHKTGTNNNSPQNAFATL